MKIILFELNEVPLRIIDHFCKLYPQSALARIQTSGRRYETVTEDVGHLSPWVTWPTVHRGVTNERHFIADFGQDLSEQDDAYPTIWRILAARGVSVGMFGSLHTYPMPHDMTGFSFYVPDTFAAGSECFPQKLSVFQDFNLSMARESSRVVSDGVPGRQAMRFLMNLPDLGFRFRTAVDIASQMVDERVNRWKVVRRRTYQSVIGFEVFFKQMAERRPDFSTFFTNHVASSLHRYWAAAFPEDYDNMTLGHEWVRTYNREIVFTMRKADQMIDRLVRFVDRNPDYSLWVMSSMGQHAVETREIATELFVTDAEKFMANFNLGKDGYELKPSMVPQFNVQISVGKRREFEEKLATFRVSGKDITWREKGAGFYSLDVGFSNLDERSIRIELMGQSIPLDRSGLKNVKIQDRCGATAYHIPEGSLLIYGRGMASSVQQTTSISTTDIAPALLRNFNVPVPAYMSKGLVL
jgi:hypothetical protein